MQSADGCSIHLHGSARVKMAWQLMSYHGPCQSGPRQPASMAPMPGCLACLNMKCGVVVPSDKSPRSKVMRTHSQVHLII